MIPDVLAEHAMAKSLERDDLRSLLVAGIPAAALTWSASGDLMPLMRDRVVFEGGRFEFARYLRDTSASMSAYTLPLLDECGEAVDLLAFQPGGPAALWLGKVGIAGAEQLWLPRPDLGEAIDVHPDQMSWLRAGRVGIVVLDATRAIDMLDGITLRVSDTAFAWRLRRMLTRSPRVIVAEGGAGCATLRRDRAA